MEQSHPRYCETLQRPSYTNPIVSYSNFEKWHFLHQFLIDFKSYPKELESFVLEPLKKAEFAYSLSSFGGTVERKNWFWNLQNQKMENNLLEYLGWLWEMGKVMFLFGEFALFFSGWPQGDLKVGEVRLIIRAQFYHILHTRLAVAEVALNLLASKNKSKDFQLCRNEQVDERRKEEVTSNAVLAELMNSEKADNCKKKKIRSKTNSSY